MFLLRRYQKPRRNYPIDVVGFPVLYRAWSTGFCGARQTHDLAHSLAAFSVVVGVGVLARMLAIATTQLVLSWSRLALVEPVELGAVRLTISFLRDAAS